MEEGLRILVCTQIEIPKTRRCNLKEMAITGKCNAKWPCNFLNFFPLREPGKYVARKGYRRGGRGGGEEGSEGKTRVGGVVPGEQSSSGEWARRTLLQVRFHWCYSSRWTEL
jgi:hypothetical protein